MNYLSLFSGAGGFEWFGKLMGWRCVGYVEKDEHCQKILKARIRDGIFDDAPIFSDVRTFDGLPYCGRVDCITAGFPCQPFSVAGKQRAIADERNMWPDTARIIREVDPPQVFLENVPGLLSGTHGYFGSILGELADLRRNAEWDCVSASDVGALHRRRRLWVVTNSHGVDLRNELEWNQKTLGTETIVGSDGETEPLADTPRFREGRLSTRSRGEGKGTPDSHRCGEAVADSPSFGRNTRSGIVGIPCHEEDGTDFERRCETLPYSNEFDGHDERYGTGAILGTLGEPSQLSGNIWWELEPELGRVAHGVANRSHRLRALGNGIVPAVAREAWLRLTA